MSRRGGIPAVHGREEVNQPTHAFKRKTKVKDGIVRDAKTGVVLARDHQHPDADNLKSIPSEAGIYFQLPAEMRHIIMLHLVDNLGYRQVEVPKYEYVPPEENAQADMNPGSWEAPQKGRKAAKNSAGNEPPPEMPTGDPAEWTPEELAVVENRLRREKVRRSLEANADPGVVAGVQQVDPDELVRRIRAGQLTEMLNEQGPR